jgi:HEAT repeat protein
MTSTGARIAGLLAIILAAGLAGCSNHTYATREEQQQYDSWRAWIKVLDDPKHSNHAYAPDALGNFNSFPLVTDRGEAVGPLTRAMTGSEAPAFRAAAARSLGAIGKQEAIFPLMLAAGDREPAVRAAAVAALGELASQLRDHPGIYRPIGGEAQTLIKRLSDDASPVRAAAARAIGKIMYNDAKTDVAALLKDADADVRREAAETLAAVSPPAEAWPALYDLVQHDRTDVRIAAAKALLWAGGDPKATELLRQAAGDPEPGLRAAAVRSLGYVRGPQTLDAVLDALDDPQESVRAAAVEAACRYDDKAAEPLVRRLAKSMPARPESHFQVLSRIRGATPPVMALLKSDDPAVRRVGVRLIAFACHSGVEAEVRPAVERLAIITRDGPDDLRASAAAALGHLHFAEAGTTLAESITKDPQPSVRAAAAMALGCLTHDIHQSYRIQHSGLRPVDEKEPEVPGADALVTALKDKDATVRVAALRGLAMAEKNLDASVLRSLLEDPDTAVRLEVARSVIQTHGGLDRYSLLQACLANDRWEVRRETVQFLGEVGNPLAMERLRDPAEYPEVRIAAIRALTKAALTRVPAMERPEDRGRLTSAVDTIARDVTQPPEVRAAAMEAYNKLYVPPMPAR